MGDVTRQPNEPGSSRMSLLDEKRSKLAETHCSGYGSLEDWSDQGRQHYHRGQKNRETIERRRQSHSGWRRPLVGRMTSRYRGFIRCYMPVIGRSARRPRWAGRSCPRQQSCPGTLSN
jgi:hypothetical protein